MRFLASSIWDNPDLGLSAGGIFQFGDSEAEPQFSAGGLGLRSRYLITTAPGTTWAPDQANPVTVPSVSAVTVPSATAPSIAAPPSSGIGTAAFTGALLNGPLHVLDSQLAKLALQPSGLHADTALQSSLSAFNALHTSTSGGQYIAIDASAKDGSGAALLQQLEGIGLQQGASYGNAAGGLLPVDKIISLVGLSDLAHASVSESMTNAGIVDTQADQTLLAQAARFSNTGIDGTGITIGVMSDSFNQYGQTHAPDSTTDQTTGDLPSGADMVVLHDDNTNGEDEGRAMSQLVHDLAPGAKIVFSDDGNSQASMAAHITDLMNAGCKVIVDDITYLGEPAFQDGPISQAINAFTAAGGIYLTSAANQARNSFEATTFTLSGQTINGEQAAKLTTGATNTQFIPVTVPNGANVTFLLQWDQPAGSVNAAHAVAKDLNIYGYNAAGTALIDTTTQDTTSQIGGDPVAGFAVHNTTGADEIINLAVTLGAGTTAADIHDFKIFAFKAGGGDLTVGASSLNINSGTVFGHATSTAFTVAAVPYFYTPYSQLVGFTDNYAPVLEPFSSSGYGTIYFDTSGNRLATPIHRTGPVITSVDGGNTTFFGGPGSDDDKDPDSNPNFYGTSAAAPDAAAVVVLMLQANPSLNRADVLALLQDSAWDVTRRANDAYTTASPIAAGFDTDSGSGLINAQLAVNSAQTLTIQPTALQTQFLGTHLNDTFAFDNMVEVVDTLKEPFPVAERFLKATDHIDGGAGSDTVTLNGDYAAHPVVFTATTMVNVERLALNPGHSYTLTTADATVAAGARLTVDASALGAANVLNLNVAAESNGFLSIAGGLGADLIHFSGTNLGASDVVNGGTGTAIDVLYFATAASVAASAFQQVSHIEALVLPNNTNSVALGDAMVGSADDSHLLTIYGGTGNDTINGSAVTTATNSLVFRSGAGSDTLTGGLGADTFYFAAADLTSADTVSGGGGTSLDRLVLTTAGTVAATAFQKVTHVEQLVLANGTNNIALANAMVGAADDNHTLYVTGGTGNDTVNAIAVTTPANRVYITAGAGNDVLIGGLGLDIFYFAPTNLTSADTVNGNAGASLDTLAFTAAGTIAAAAFTHVSHVEEVVLANGTNSLTLSDALIATADDGHVLYAIGGTGNDTINAGTVATATNRVYFFSGAGNDVLTGGAGADNFFFTAANLTSADTVNGGAGTAADSLLFSTAGTIAAAAFTNVSHIERIYLANGANNVTLTNALVTSADDGHVLHITGGTGADTINAAAVTTATNRVVFIGGGGADAMTSGAGADIFSFLSAADSTSTAYDTITSFNYAADRFDVPGTVSLVEAARTGALDTGANFNTELAARFSTLAGHHAGLLTASSGTLSGQTFLVVDLNGTAGYQAGSDLVLHLVSPTGTLVVGDFI